jgi:hypothetical protein
MPILPGSSVMPKSAECLPILPILPILPGSSDAMPCAVHHEAPACRAQSAFRARTYSDAEDKADRGTWCREGDDTSRWK